MKCDKCGCSLDGKYHHWYVAGNIEDIEHPICYDCADVYAGKIVITDGYGNIQYEPKRATDEDWGL